MANLSNRQIKSLIKQTIATYQQTADNPSNKLGVLVAKQEALIELLDDIKALENKS